MMFFGALFTLALAVNAVAFASSGKPVHLAFCAVAITGVWMSLHLSERRS